jgi:nitrogen fixation/metabolism regulation signal transduction histidine kinase
MAVWFAVIIEWSMYVEVEGMLGPTATRYCFLFLALCVVSMGLLFIYDAVKHSHRIVGPIYRFRKTIQAITAGEELEFVSLRKEDMLHELKDDFNAMLRALEQRGAVVLKTPEAKQEREQLLSA